MDLLFLSLRSLRRTPTRTALTLAAAVVSLICFVLLRTIVTAYSFYSDRASDDRLYTRHKIAAGAAIPAKDLEAIRALAGVKSLVPATLLPLTNPRDQQAIVGWSCDADTMFTVFDEVALPPEQRRAWEANRRGAIVGDVLAKKLGLQVGREIALQSRLGEVSFTIEGIYQVTGKAQERTNLYFHRAYHNELLPPQQRDHVGWIFVQADGAGRAAQVGQSIDDAFEKRGVATITVSERDFGLSLLGNVAAILVAVDAASVIIMVIMGLILGNTIAMATRERTREYAVLRALGFQKGHVATFVLAEAACVGVVGGVLGAVLSYPLVELLMGRWLEENVGALVPYFRIDPWVLVAAVGLSVGLSVVSALIPAYTASRLSVVDALRSAG